MNTVLVSWNRLQSATAHATQFRFATKPDKRWRPTSLDCELFEYGDDTVSADLVINHDGETLPGEFIDHVQHFDLAAVDGPVELEINCPNHVRSDR